VLRLGVRIASQERMELGACTDSRDLWDANVAPSRVKSDEDRRENRLAIDELHDGRPPTGIRPHEDDRGSRTTADMTSTRIECAAG